MNAAMIGATAAAALFAPDFVELEENEEYVEREDEFDLNPREEEAEEVALIDEDADIDIETNEKNTMFSDVEDSVDEIVFLPPISSPDYPDEQPEKYPGSSSKLEGGNPSNSLSSKVAVQNSQAIPLVPSPIMEVNKSAAEDRAEGPNSNRKRRLPMKGLELQQAEKGSRTPTKNKSNGRSPKSSVKKMQSAPGNSSAFDEEAAEDDEVNIET